MPNSKDKGSRFERWCATELRPFFPNVATARLMSKDADDRGVDLVRTGDFAFQCKHYAKRTPNDWEVLEKMDTKDMKAIIKKIDRKEALIVMRFEDFKKCLKEYP
jgi:hypothetical protein